MAKPLLSWRAADDDGIDPIAGGQYLSCTIGPLAVSGNTYNDVGRVVHDNQVEGQITLIA